MCNKLKNLKIYVKSGIYIWFIFFFIKGFNIFPLLISLYFRADMLNKLKNKPLVYTFRQLGGFLNKDKVLKYQLDLFYWKTIFLRLKVGQITLNVSNKQNKILSFIGV